MLVLVIPQTCTSVLFVFDLRLYINHGAIGIIFNEIWNKDCLKKSDTFWLASALREVKAGQGTVSCMLCHLSYFILPLSH